MSTSARADLRETLNFYRAPSQLADAFSYAFESGVRHLRPMAIIQVIVVATSPKKTYVFGLKTRSSS